MTPALFQRACRIGHILLLGERVDVHSTQPDPVLNAPCLYEFSVWSVGGSLRSVYIGQASRGIGRPLEQYQEIIANLRENRRRGIRRDQVTNWPYKNKNPWDFRWVHHELESALYKNAEAPLFKVELCVNPLEPGLAKSALNDIFDTLRSPLPWAAASLTAAAYAMYRRRGGSKHGPLPDFFIGAHAAVSKLSVLTRDPRSYRNHFAKLEVIAP